MNQELLTELQQVLSDNEIVLNPGADGRLEDWLMQKEMAAEILVRPSTTEQVSQVLALCNKYKQNVIPLGGTTGLVGGTRSNSDDLMLSLERLNKIESINPIDKTMRVQSGVILQTIHEAAAEYNLEFPVTLGAKGSAQIGGIAATNAGGNNVLLNGMARANILGLEAVLASGEVVSSMNQLLKNNTGLDLKQLFIGSEGILGVITRLDLRLTNLAPQVQSAFISLNSFEDVLHVLKEMQHKLNGQLSAFELMWNDFYRIAANAEHIAKKPFNDESPFYVLLEYSSAEGDVFVEVFQEALMSLIEDGHITDAAIAHSESDREQFWMIRENIESMKTMGPIYGYDVSLPTSDMPAYTSAVKQVISEYSEDAKLVIFGHIGDCNLHILVGLGEYSAETKQVAEKAVYDSLAPFNGSVSAEHGIGIDKKPFLGLSRSPLELNLMKQIKQMLDPNNIINAGKVL